MLERGEKSPSLRTLFDLASTLGVASSEIVKQVERIVRSDE
jgi:transcriptional regulator with XRE-family HTH domain